MKKLAICMGAFAAAVMSAALMTGCDWAAGSAAESWNDSFNAVNFNGVYRGVSGGVLITDYTATPGTAGTTNTITDEHVATGDGSSTTFFKALNHDKVMPGTVTVVLPGYTFTDNGSGGLSGTSGTSGTIDYGTGFLTLDFNGAAPDAGIQMRASYLYTVAGSTGAGAPGPGTSGITIFSFTVQHDGENLVITDNNGSTYEGTMGRPRATTSVTDSNGVAVINGPVIASFHASGVSGSGFEVNMTGTFQGTVAAGVMSGRVMLGTWIEDGGRTGDINGQASPIAVANNTTP